MKMGPQIFIPFFSSSSGIGEAAYHIRFKFLRSYFSTSGTVRNDDGTYSETLVATGVNSIYFRANADFIGDIDNVSVKILTFLGGENRPLDSQFRKGRFDFA